jgi:hypothetical protein
LIDARYALFVFFSRCGGAWVPEKATHQKYERGMGLMPLMATIGWGDATTNQKLVFAVGEMLRRASNHGITCGGVDKVMYRTIYFFT